MASFVPIQNTEMHRAMLALRSSSAAQPHADRRVRRARTRKAQLTRVLKDY